MFLKTSDMQLGKVRFEETFAPGEIEFFDQQLRQKDAIVASGVAQLSEATMEIRVSGHLAARVEAPCDRCLEPTEHSVDADFSLVYRPASLTPEHEEVAIVPAEADVAFYEGEGLELTDVVREQILLLLPMQRICREECKGICPVCGQNRNQVECQCRQQLSDDRWAGLRNL
ncbi:MAG: YceD family protein [Acidobacteriota bacterium]|nr:DUF177 domain-containing protein [Polyangiaceae bacterium]